MQHLGNLELAIDTPLSKDATSSQVATQRCNILEAKSITLYYNFKMYILVISAPSVHQNTRGRPTKSSPPELTSQIFLSS